MGKANCSIKLSGYDEIIKDIEKLGGNAEKIVSDAILKSGEVATGEFKKVIEGHKYTGLTEDMLKTDLAVENEAGKIVLKTGFDINKGGLASILLDKGTPTNAPLNFVKKTKNKKSVKEALEKELRKGWERAIR